MEINKILSAQLGWAATRHRERWGFKPTKDQKLAFDRDNKSLLNIYIHGWEAMEWKYLGEDRVSVSRSFPLSWKEGKVLIGIEWEDCKVTHKWLKLRSSFSGEPRQGKGGTLTAHEYFCHSRGQEYEIISLLKRQDIILPKKWQNSEIWQNTLPIEGILSVPQRREVGNQYGWCWFHQMEREVPILLYSPSGDPVMIHLGSPDIKSRGEVFPITFSDLHIVEAKGAFNSGIKPEDIHYLASRIEEILEERRIEGLDLATEEVELSGRGRTLGRRVFGR